jgi:hypothetical protein
MKERITTVFGFLMPLWCALIITTAYLPVRKNDDPYWWASFVFAFCAGIVLLATKRVRLGAYSLVVAGVVLYVGDMLPGLIR